MSNASAVVFAYHNVGARCLSVLLAHGVDVRLVVTHEDDPAEMIWFDRVADIAALNGIPAITPAAAELPALVERLREAAPDFVFSFYYRHMLPAALLGVPARGALNMHGSLLPKYRGRAPVNWAVLHGETETGASLHYMTVKPDAGALVAQQGVPILPNDTAREVFEKVTCAAEVALAGVLPSLIDGTAPAVPLDLARGSYFGRRGPEDGHIDWTRSARDIHNLVRAVAPPYPGAFATLADRPLRLLRSYFRNEPARHRDKLPCFYAEAGALYVDCRDGRRFRVLAAELDGAPLTATAFKARFGDEPLPLGD
ncbi:MAG TPA: formyltransferase [Gammaproteobacteria bacterium]|nr:formyltransferase [Gammaproteobacteria bacterium]